MSSYIPTVRPAIISILLILLLGLSACQVVLDSNYTLSSGEMVSGNLLVPSANVTLEEGSRVGGSALVFCCNVDARGEIDEALFVGAGNVMLGPQAVVGGAVTLVEGNLEVAPEASIAGATQRGLPARLVFSAIALLSMIALLPLALVVLLVRRRKRG